VKTKNSIDSAGSPRVTLEQWRALLAVVEHDGYAGAAEALGKSQSTVTYAVKRLEALAGVQVFRVSGRRARLTPAGEVLYRRARALVREAADLEGVATSLARGWEPEIHIAVETILPIAVLLAALDAFQSAGPTSRIEVHEGVLSGTEDALLARRVDLAVTSHVPPGFLGESLMRIRFLPVSAPQHALQHLGRTATRRDLQAQRQVVVRDSGAFRRRGADTLIAERRLTVSYMTTSIRAIQAGLGFAWLPEEKIRAELDAGTLLPVPLGEHGERFANLYLVLADPDHAGPGARRLAELLRSCAHEQCPQAAPQR
jgi:DNA-binding transcriptional LysR family regulator